jgi:hypothetical protein
MTKSAKRVLTVNHVAQPAGGVGVRTGLRAGEATSDVVTEKLGPDLVQHKHLAGVKYEG